MRQHIYITNMRKKGGTSDSYNNNDHKCVRKTREKTSLYKYIGDVLYAEKILRCGVGKKLIYKKSAWKRKIRTREKRGEHVVALVRVCICVCAVFFSLRRWSIGQLLFVTQIYPVDAFARKKTGAYSINWLLTVFVTSSTNVIWSLVIFRLNLNWDRLGPSYCLVYLWTNLIFFFNPLIFVTIGLIRCHNFYDNFSVTFDYFPHIIEQNIYIFCAFPSSTQFSH